MNKLIKRAAIYILAFALLFVFSAINLFENKPAKPASTVNTTVKTIIIDPGHGGFDGGAMADDGTTEKDINLNISKTLGEFLRIAGYDTVFSRYDDSSTESSGNTIKERKVSDMKNRLALMETYPDSIFVSIHLNKFTQPEANGTQVFYSQNLPESRELSIKVQNTVKELLQNDNERKVKAGTETTYLLYKATVPAIIVECGFLSNPNELEKLKNVDYQNEMAYSVFCGILEYMSDK